MSLANLLAKRAVSRADYDGAGVAAAYGDTELEWAALDASAALVEMPYRRTIIASGTERRPFLHGQLSQTLVTLKTGEAHYFSRSRNVIWHKGGTSGHVQKVREIYLDCDQDAVLLKIEQVGGAACHTGYPSCFYRRREKGGWAQSSYGSKRRPG